MSAVVDAVRGIFARRRETAIAGYSDLVRRVAAGERITPEQAAGVVEQAGRSEEQFAADVAARLERVRLAALVAGRSAAEKARAAAVAAVQEIDRQAEAAAEKFREQAAPHRNAAAQAERSLAAADAAEQQLLAGYAGPLRGELATVEAELQRCNAEQADLRRKAQEAQSHEATVATTPEKYPDGEVDRIRARLSRLRSQIAEAVSLEAALVQRRETIYAQMLTP